MLALGLWGLVGGPLDDAASCSNLERKLRTGGGGEGGGDALIAPRVVTGDDEQRAPSSSLAAMARRRVVRLLRVRPSGTILA